MKLSSLRVVVFALCSLFVVCSCNNNRTKSVKELEDEFIKPDMVISKTDSEAVRKLGDQYMEFLKNKKFEEAIGMLYYLKGNDSLFVLPENLANQQRLLYKRFPVLNYKFDNLIFNREADNQMTYSIEFFEKAEDDPRPNTTRIFLRPIRLENNWYLTVADTGSRTGDKSKFD